MIPAPTNCPAIDIMLSVALAAAFLGLGATFAAFAWAIVKRGWFSKP